MATFTATALQAEPLDALVWRVLGSDAGTGSGVVEQVLELNRDIAGGALTPASVLAEGQPVILPVLARAQARPRDIVQLWD